MAYKFEHLHSEQVSLAYGLSYTQAPPGVCIIIPENYGDTGELRYVLKMGLKYIEENYPREIPEKFKDIRDLMRNLSSS